MGVSLYYTARRERELNEDERGRIAEIRVQENQELFERLNRLLQGWRQDGTVPSNITDARELCEGLHFYDEKASIGSTVILEGSSKVSHGQCEVQLMMEQLEYYMRFALGRLRRALPDAEWEAHVDDHALMWDEESGEYAFSSG